jgi:hypothetical protein
MIEFPEQYSPSVCDSCGDEFGCGAKLDGCWCNDLKLDPGGAETLKNKFDGCLCPKCLAVFASPPAEVDLDAGTDPQKSAA